MQGTEAKKQRLVKTMRAFFAALEQEKCCLINGRMPPKQSKIMDSIIKQAAALSANA